MVADEEAGDVTMGVGDVGGEVGHVGEMVEDELEEEAKGSGAGRGRAKLAQGLEA